MTYDELLNKLIELKESGKKIGKMEVVFYINPRTFYEITDVKLKPVYHSENQKHIALIL